MKQKILSLLLCLVLILSLAACGMAPKEDQAFTTEAAVEVPMEMPMAEEAYLEDGGALNAGVTGEAQTDIRPTSEKIIYTATLNLETTEFETSTASFEQSVGQFGGYVLSSDVGGDTGYHPDGSMYVYNRNAYYSVAIPAEKLDAFLSQTGTLGVVTSNNKSAENVTSQYTDFEARLSSLQTEETRLLELLAKADDVESLIVLEDKLSDVRYEIEYIQRSLKDLDRRLAYSTVDVYIREVRENRSPSPVNRTFGQRLGDAFLTGVNDFVDALGEIAVWFAEAWIALLFLAAIVVVIVLIVKKSRKKAKAKKAAEEKKD